MYTRSINVPLDPTGQLTHPFYLDVLSPFLLAALLFLLEWRFGSTIGKRVLGLYVRSIDGKPLHAIEAAKRTALRMIPLLAFMASSINQTFSDPAKWAIEAFDHPTNAMVETAATWLLPLIFAINFIVTTRRHTLPWHDEWAETEVVRQHEDLSRTPKDVTELFT